MIKKKRVVDMILNPWCCSRLRFKFVTICAGIIYKYLKMMSSKYTGMCTNKEQMYVLVWF